MNIMQRVILGAVVISGVGLIGCGSSEGSSSTPANAGKLSLTVEVVYPESGDKPQVADTVILTSDVTSTAKVKTTTLSDTVSFDQLAAAKYTVSASNYESHSKSCVAIPVPVDLKKNDTITIMYQCSASPAPSANASLNITNNLPTGTWAKLVIADVSDNKQARYVARVQSKQTETITWLAAGNTYNVSAAPMPGMNYNPTFQTITIKEGSNSIKLDFKATKKIVAVYMQTKNIINPDNASLDARANNLISLFSDYKNTTNKPEVILAFIRPHFDFDINNTDPAAPVADGIGFEFPTKEKITYAALQNFISKLQDNSISVFISVGGWVYSGNTSGSRPPGKTYSFPNPASKNIYPNERLSNNMNGSEIRMPWQQSPTSYINNWVSLAQYLGADGVDLDYAEVWYADATRIPAYYDTAPGSYLLSTAAEKFGAILTQLKLAANKQGLRVSITAPAVSTMPITQKEYLWWGDNLKGLYYCTAFICATKPKPPQRKRSKLNALYKDVFKGLDHIGVMTYDLQPTLLKNSKVGGIKKVTTLKSQVATYLKRSQKFFNRFAPGVPVLGGIEIGQPSWPSPAKGSGYMVPFNSLVTSAISKYLTKISDFDMPQGTIIWELDKTADINNVYKNIEPFGSMQVTTYGTPATVKDIIDLFAQQDSD